VIFQIAVLPFVPVSLLDQLGFTRTAMAINILSLIVIPYYAGFSGFYYLVKVRGAVGGGVF